MVLHTHTGKKKKNPIFLFEKRKCSDMNETSRDPLGGDRDMNGMGQTRQISEGVWTLAWQEQRMWAAEHWQRGW